MTDTRTKISFVKDETTGTYILSDPSGKTLTHIERGGQKPAAHKLPDGEYVSAARIAMERIKAAKTVQNRTERLDSNGTWYVRKLQQSEIFKIGMLTNRDESGNMDLMDTDDLKSFVAACLFVAVASDEAGEENAFGSYPEAYAWANEIDEDITETVGKLFTRIMARNPKLIEKPREPTADETKAAEKKSVNETPEGEPSATATTLPTTSD